MDNSLEKALVELHSHEEKIRVKAIITLREMTEEPEARHALRSAIHDESGRIRFLAAETLARARLYPDDVLPVLISVIEVADQADIAIMPESKNWRRVAAGVIGNYRDAAKAAIPVLRNALLDPDYNVRGYAAKSLGSIGPEAIVALQDLRAARQVEEDENIRTVYENAIKQITQSKRFIVIAQDEEGNNNNDED